jgi:hypothetical protein
MGNEDTRYRVDEPRILAEEISGEVLAIDNRTGAYMSITQSGVAIWNLVSAGYSPAEAADALTLHHTTDAEAVRDAVLAFVNRLVENELVVPTERDAPPMPAMVNDVEPGPFRAPKLDRYTDMEDMLLFDPIHDVDEQGWPEIEPGANRG